MLSAEEEQTSSESRGRKWGDWWQLGCVCLVCRDEDFRLNLEANGKTLEVLRQKPARADLPTRIMTWARVWMVAWCVQNQKWAEVSEG